MRTKVRGPGAAFLIAVALVPTAWAQTPQGTRFTYQGRLTDGGGLASGPYDFQFVLYDAPVDGSQVGPTVALEDVTVSAGLFTVSLDFGVVFGVEERWLELGVRPGADTGAYTPILPRQELTPGPTAIFSAAAGDSLELGGVPASQYVLTDDARLSDARIPLPGSPDYVQNGLAPQAGVSFNVGGTGTANVLDAATQYDLGGTRILANPGTNNLFAGANAGASHTTGVANAFFGAEAGSANTTGGSNSFFGFNAGRNTTTSHNNSFFGDAAGFANTTGGGGSFFGFLAGFNNTTGSGNSFFGQFSGAANTIGFGNAFFGDAAGAGNTTGTLNAFYGRSAGVSNTTGLANAFFGAGAGGLNTTGFTNTFVGRDAGYFSTSGSSNVFVGAATGATNTTGGNNTLLGFQANVGAANLSFATAIGAGAVVGASNTVSLGRSADTVQVPGSLTVNGTFGASVLNATSQFNLAGSRILSAPGTGNLFSGIGAGTANTGQGNSFFGQDAGLANTDGSGNAFFGQEAGLSNVSGSGNAFFGSRAGRANLATNNAFFGSGAGDSNTTGILNAFFGAGAGGQNTDGAQSAIFGAFAGFGNGSFNAYFGNYAGNNMTSGSRNTFLGWFAGANVTTGNDNTFVGSVASADTIDTFSTGNTLLGANTRVSPGVFTSTAIGARAQVTQSNSLVLGSIQGVNGGQSTKVGIGTPAPNARLHVVDGGNILFGGSPGCPGYAGLVFATSISATCQNYSVLGGDGSTYINRPGGGTIFFREGNFTQVSIKPGGIVGIEALAGGGTAMLCRNPSNEIAFCSSSLRYKTDVAPFRGGLEVVDRLQPISFTWKGNGKRDIGLGAEEAAQVEPLLAFRNGDGEIEGVNYAQLNVVLVNAIKQQQARSQAQEEQLQRQGREIEALKALVCQANPQAGLCLGGPRP